MVQTNSLFEFSASHHLVTTKQIGNFCANHNITHLLKFASFNSSHQVNHDNIIEILCAVTSLLAGKSSMSELLKNFMT